MSDALQADLLEGLPYPPTHFDLYSLDQLQEDDRESERYIHVTVDHWDHLYTRCFILNYFFWIYFVELMREHQKQLKG